MGVNYADDVASASGWKWAWKVIARWKGSLYQALWLPVLIYFTTYIGIGLLYKFALSTSQQGSFNSFARYCDRYSNQMPVALMLGFFTSTVMNRWWAVCSCMPGTDGVITQACITIPYSEDGKSTAMVRTISRFTLLTWVLNMRIICGGIRHRFPTLKAIEDAGLLLPHETSLVEDIDPQYQNTKPWLPLTWSTLILREAATEGRINSNQDAVNLINVVDGFRNNCSTVLKYYFTNIPLVATQSVTLVVHTFGLATLFGKQFFDPNAPNPVLLLQMMYVPILPVLQYIGYLGWLKLAEILINPFGDDEDDFDLVRALDKNLKTSAFILKVFETQEDYPAGRLRSSQISEAEEAGEGEGVTEKTHFRI